MKKLITLFMLAEILLSPVVTQAQDTTETEDAAVTTTAQPSRSNILDDVDEEEQKVKHILHVKLIEGRVSLMTPILICLLLGSALALEPLITLYMSSTNAHKLLANVDDALEAGG